jgi:hypothetical protein
MKTPTFLIPLLILTLAPNPYALAAPARPQPLRSHAVPQGVSTADWTSVQQQAYLKASSPGGADEFARAVAISGDTVVVGVDYEDSRGTDSGAAYVFVRNGTNWSEQAYLKAANAAAGDRFGFAVAISGDIIVVGALFEAGTGAAHVFVRNGTNWTEQAYLKASNAEADDLFADEVAISGETIVVASFNEGSNATGVNGDQNNNDARGSGAVYVYVREGTTWIQQAYLKASNTGAGDAFYKLGISGDTIVVGAIREDSDATGINGDQNNKRALESGSAYVFVRDGTNWTQQAYLKGSNTRAGDRFGFVSISGDTILVGAFREDNTATGINGELGEYEAIDSGAAYVFVRHGTIWTQQAYLKASNAEADDRFGWAVSLSGDTAVIGAHQEDSAATGVNGDENDNNASNAGAAYIFLRTGTNWSQQAYLKSSNAEADDNFGGGPNLAPGTTVAISGGTVVIGSSYEASSATGVNGDQTDNSLDRSGAAYIFNAPIAAPTLSITRDHSAGHLIRFNGVPQATYRLERATDITGPWGALGLHTTDSSGLADFHDANPAAKKAFYRALAP